MPNRPISEEMMYIKLKKFTIFFLALGFFISLSNFGFLIADEPSGWAKKEVEKAINQRLVPVEMRNNYKKNITRGEFCLLFSSFLDTLPKENSKLSDPVYIESLLSQNKFKDIDPSDKIGKAVLIAKSKKIISGRSDTIFDPKAEISREEAAKILGNSLLYLKTMQKGEEKVALEVKPYSYKDSSDISSWAEYGVKICTDYKIMKGVSNNNFLPKGYYTREQAYLTFLRLGMADKFIDNPENIPADTISKEDTEDKSLKSSELKTKILDLVNAERKKAGVNPIKAADNKVQAYADLRAEEIIINFSHIRPDGTKALDGIDGFSKILESIASGQNNPEELLQYLMNSDVKASILDNAFEKLAIGISTDGNNDKKWVLLLYKDGISSLADNDGKSLNKNKINEYKNRILELVNIERKNRSIPPLSEADQIIKDYADLRAEEVVKKFSHSRPDGSEFFSGISGYSFVGENIAGGLFTPEEVVKGWMNSEGHRANILKPEYTTLAIGFSQGGKYKVNWVQIFYTPW